MGIKVLKDPKGHLVLKDRWDNKDLLVPQVLLDLLEARVLWEHLEPKVSPVVPEIQVHKDLQGRRDHWALQDSLDQLVVPEMLESPVPSVTLVLLEQLAFRAVLVLKGHPVRRDWRVQ